MNRLRAAPLLVLALAACTDDPTGPRLAASVQILSSALPFDEQTIRVAETVQLSAASRDAAGKEVPGRVVRWTSSAPGVATVDTAGLVRGVSLGTALIVATSDASADTARINVAAPVTGPVACAPGQSPLSLGVGQMYATNAWELPTLCFQGGAAGAEFLLVPFHASGAAGAARLPLDITASGVVTSSGRSDALAPLPAATGDPTAPRPDAGFHQLLRERAHSGLSPRMRALREGGLPGPSRSLWTAATPEVGDRMRLNVETRSGDGCTSPVFRTGRVVAVTERAIVVADTANPAGGFTDEEYRAFGSAFDRLVYPLNVEQFGAPSDLDRNQRVIMFFTSAVNALTSAGSGFYIGGFFYDRDLFPRSGRSACEGSNAAEMFYLMVPDPARQALEPVFSKEGVQSSTLAVIAHEFQHLINASRRLHVNQAGTWEATWLNEGLSHIAEELLFYRASGLQPRMNEDGSRVAVDPARKALLEYQLDNVERYIQFLRSPQTASPMGEDVLPTRGAVWGFLRYAADRRGGSEQSTWFRLANSKTSGLANLNEVLGGDAVSWMGDWALSLYLDDSGLPSAERFRQPSWNFRALFPRLQGQIQDADLRRYPLRTLRFEFDHRLRLELPGGGAAFVRVEVPAGQPAAVRVTSGELPAPRKLQLTVVRTR